VVTIEFQKQREASAEDLSKVKTFKKLVIYKDDTNKIVFSNLELATARREGEKLVIEVVAKKIELLTVEERRCDVCGRTRGEFITTRDVTICTKCKENLWK